MGSPAVFQGVFTKLLTQKLNLADKAYILTGTQDPRSVATDAPKGSLLLRQGSSGQVFAKQDDGSTTNWKLLPFSSAFDYSVAPAAGFQMAYVDDFDVGPTDSASLVDNSSRTNATYDPVRQLYRMSCDKTRTVTTVGTAYTLSAAPSFSLAPGDIIWSGSTWRRITTVYSSTNGLIDAAFPSDLSLSSCMVSQAVWTKDLTGFVGSAADKTRPQDFFPSTQISSVNMDYFDSLAVNDDIPDFVDVASVVAACSSEGLSGDTGVPDSTDFTSIFTRPQAPSQIPDYPLMSLPDMDRLFSVFFPNPNNASVVSGANLCRYRISFYADSNLAEGGVLDSAFAMSDGSATEVNCYAPFLSSGKTRIRLMWNYIPNINPGLTAGDLEVLVDGKVIPRRVVGATQDAYFTEVTGTTDTIEFWTDISVASVSVEIRRRQGSIDTSDQNASDLDNILSPLYLTSNTTLSQRAYTRVLADTSGGAFQVTLPASPSLGDRVEVQDPEGTWFTSNVTIDPNGNNIQSASGNDSLDVNYGWVMYEWVGGTEGWMVRT